ncbi:MAG TPA: SGNH/GDSL hydrolase family protein [Candidatus Acidoferrum sp.]|nr:SGNH/GDSL hydrolase family protein [Candidatus Acidoferrum sp.]
MLLVVLALAGAEAGMRFLASRGRTEMTATHMSDPVLHHRIRPNVAARVRGAEFRTSSLGLHDREYPAGKPAGVFRVLLLGDSMTEGGGLALEATMAKQAEAMLNAGGCRSPVEVVNGGVASYSPILQYLYLKALAPALEPDVVVLNFDMTDVHDDLIRTAIARLGPDGLPVAVPANRRLETAMFLLPIPKPSFLRFLEPVERGLSRLLIYQAFRRSGVGRRLFGPIRPTPERLESLGLVGDIRYDPMAITRPVEGPGVTEAWGLTERYLAGIHGLARRRGMRFAVVVYPHPHQVAADESPVGRQQFALRPGLFTSEAPFRRIEAVGRREGFAVINLLEHFRRRRATDGPLFWDHDIHQNPRGARVFAEGVVTGLRAHDLLPCARSSEERVNDGRQR